jgi:hypothetical protein
MATFPYYVHGINMVYSLQIPGMDMNTNLGLPLGITGIPMSFIQASWHRLLEVFPE